METAGETMPKRSTLKLTKRIVEKLKAGDKDAIYWDRELAGFGVRVHATGRKLFIVQSRGPAGLKRATLGPAGAETIEMYRSEAAVAIDRIKQGEDPRPPKPAPEPTVADLAARCVSVRFGVRCKPATAKHYKMALDRHVLPVLGTMPLSEVGPKEAAALHHRMRGMPAMANRAVWVLSRLFVMAETWEMVPPGRNPCRHVRYYREKSRERFLTPEEFRRLGAALRTFEARGGDAGFGGRRVASADADRLPDGRDPVPARGTTWSARRACCGCATARRGRAWCR